MLLMFCHYQSPWNSLFLIGRQDVAAFFCQIASLLKNNSRYDNKTNKNHKMLPLHSFAKNGPYNSNSIMELSDDYNFFTGSILLSKSEKSLQIG